MVLHRNPCSIMHLVRPLKCLVLAALLSALLVPSGWARDIDRKALKTGMTLPDVIQAFGQPDRMEWVTANGQSVLFVFFESPDPSMLGIGPMADTITTQDGRPFLPLGFLQEGLIGWGKKFYLQAKPSQ